MSDGYRQVVEQLRFEEGLRLLAYQDSRGVRSIGYGHNCVCRPRFRGERIPDAISREFAESLLLSDIEHVDESLHAAWPGYGRLDAVRRDACLQMAFNLGVEGFMAFAKFKNALLQGHYEQASQEVIDSAAGRELPGRYARIARQVLMGEYYEVGTC